MKKDLFLALMSMAALLPAAAAVKAPVRAASASAPTAIAADAPGRPLLHEIFADHAVLQRDRPIPIWGESAAGDAITVTLGGNTVAARADAAGHWHAALAAMGAGGPYELKVHAQSGAGQSISDVLVGDVYLCSGQSNMELPVANSLEHAREIADSSNDRIRILTVAHTSIPAPLGHFQAPVAWAAAGPETISNFSAACYYFARELQKSVQVPLGLIHSAWGGSRIEPWISESGLRKIADFPARLDLLNLYARNAKAGDDKLGELWEAWWRARAPAGSTPWARADGDWRAAPEPMRNWKTWGVPELANHDGMVWFRRGVSLTPQQAAGSATLTLGGIDEVDETWVNGRPIGNSFGWGTERTYPLAAGTLRAGENSIVVNVLSVWDAAGMYGPPEHMGLRFPDGSTVSLGGEWRYQFVPESFGYPPRAPWESVGGLTTLYNGMIAPLGSYGLRGALWYQGESNAGDAAQYQVLLTALMQDWRRQFGAQLPFLVVELPNFGAVTMTPGASDWANLREAQRRAVLGDAHAALAVTIDVGDPRQLHPPDKQDVGRRLARAARHLIYGESLSASGPVPRIAKHEQARIAVSFDGVDGSLVAYGSNRPMAFELCGAEQSSCRYVDAALESNRVLLEAKNFGGATRVRFCWGDAPICNLYDGSGLPAGPFEIPIQQ